MVLKRWQKVALAGLEVGALAFAVSFCFPAEYQICKPDEYNGAKDCAQYHLGPYAVLRVGGFLDAHNGLVTAIATAFVAWFTLTLWRTSDAQGSYTLAALELARDEFNATHRPKIFVQSVTLTDKGTHPFHSAKEPHRDATGVITIANGGDAAAFIVEWQAVVYFQGADSAFVPGLKIAPIQTPSADAPGIAPGQFQEIGHQQVHALEEDWHRFVHEDGSRMFFIGRITYQGADKIRRNTGFCREYDRIDRGAWIPVKDSEYEYTY